MGQVGLGVRGVAWKTARAGWSLSFFAFVKTKMPVIQLEIAPDSSRKVEVLSICAPDPEARSLAEVLRDASGELGLTVRRSLSTIIRSASHHPPA
jgi:hypothetical protein